MPVDIKFEGLTEFEDKLKTVIEKYPFEAEAQLKRMGNSLRRKVQDRTPIKKGSLKKSYKVSKVTYSRHGNSYITFRSTSPHFHLIERGHKLVDKKGNSVGKGYVQGKHMLENSLTELNGEMNITLGKWVDKVIGGAK